MSDEPQENPIAEYESQIEQHDFLRRQGAEAWADMMIGMLGDKIKMDPDKAILFKQGFVEMMGGGPRFPKLEAPARPPSPPDPIYIVQYGSGSTVVYDWRTILGSMTHAEHREDGSVVLFNYGDTLLELSPTDGDALWKFMEDYRAYTVSVNSMGVYR